MTVLPVDKNGLVSPSDLEEAVNDKVHHFCPVPGVIVIVRCKSVVVSIMLANNEVGTVQPIRDLVKFVFLILLCFDVILALAVAMCMYGAGCDCEAEESRSHFPHGCKSSGIPSSQCAL